MINWPNRLPWDIIYDASKGHNLDPRVIAAIIQKESAGDTWAIRYETNWRYFFNVTEIAHQQRMTIDTQHQLQKFSYGLMQVMGTVALELGLRESPLKLCAYPQIGVLFGCLKLKQLEKNHSNIEDVISAYNSGAVIKDMNGNRSNQKSYVDGVLSFVDQLKANGK